MVDINDTQGNYDKGGGRSCAPAGAVPYNSVEPHVFTYMVAIPSG